MDVLGTPPDDFMSKISSESVSYRMFMIILIKVIKNLFLMFFLGEKLYKVSSGNKKKGF